MSSPYGDTYTFHLSGWANFVFPQDKSKTAQFVTGMPYVCSHTQNIKPRVRKWFCPNQSATDVGRLTSAKNSQTQWVRFGEFTQDMWGVENYKKMNENSCIHEPDVYHYKFNILHDHWGYIDASKSSPGPYLTIYNEEYSNIQDSEGIINTIGQLGEGFVEGSYRLDCGDVIGTVADNGKFIDGIEEGRGYYGTTWTPVQVSPTANYSYWQCVGA